MQAQILTYQKDYKEALKSLDKAEQSYFMNPIPEHISIEGLRASLYLKLHQADAYQEFFDKQSYSTEQDRLVYIKYLIRHLKDEEALDILDEMLLSAQQQDRQRSIIDIMVLEAIALDLKKDTSKAILSLKNAMTLATPEGYVFPFTDHFEELSSLYRDLIKINEVPSFLKEHIKTKLNFQLKDTPAKSSNLSLLTKREMEVLQLMSQGHSNQEIGDQLYLALSTVKGYNLSIYDKLEVKRRTEAIAKAREYNIID